MSGPITRKSKTIVSSRWVYMWRIWDSQKPPFNSPLPLDFRRRIGTDGNRQVDVRSSADNPVETSPSISLCQTLAYEKFRGAVSDQAGMLINLHQRQQALDMIEKRTLQIVRFVGHLRNKKFHLAARELGLKKPPRTRKHHEKRGVASNFLEYHFGWEPIVKDIYTAAELLQLPFHEKSVKGKSPRVEDKQWLDWYNRDFRVMTTQCRLTGTVVLTNPNLWLLNQLGLLNPAIVAWDAVPFSFILDWFGTLGTYLNSLTDFLGLELKNVCAGTRVDCKTVTYAGREGTGWGTGMPLVYDVATTIEEVCVRRTLGLIGPSVHLRPLKRLSITRAATAVALLVQKLPK